MTDTTAGEGVLLRRLMAAWPDDHVIGAPLAVEIANYLAAQPSAGAQSCRGEHQPGCDCVIPEQNDAPKPSYLDRLAGAQGEAVAWEIDGADSGMLTRDKSLADDAVARGFTVHKLTRATPAQPDTGDLAWPVTLPDDLKDKMSFAWAMADDDAPEAVYQCLRAAMARNLDTGDVALHPATSDLIDRFTAALKDKLAKAEAKYGYSDGWLDADWQGDLVAKLVGHVQKGDPRDVAAYCAFAWHHGWSITPPDTGDVAALREAAWEWWASRDEENYLVGPCDTREQAVEQALEDFDGEPFHVVEACKGSMAQYLPSGESVIEWITEYADDNGAFGEDQYCELTGTKGAIESAEADAGETLKAWYARHAAIFPTPWAFHKTRNGEWVTLKAALSKPNAPGREG